MRKIMMGISAICLSIFSLISLLHGDNSKDTTTDDSVTTLGSEVTLGDPDEGIILM